MDERKDKNVFSNIYFWIAVLVALIFIFSTITLSFILIFKSRANQPKENNTAIANSEEQALKPKSEALKKSKIKLVKSSGWIDLDDGKITIVMAFDEIDAGVAKEIVKGNQFEIKIDNETAKIINAEPVESGILTRAVSTLSADKFGKFRSGANQSLEIKTTLRYEGETESRTLKEKFKKTNDVEVEGIKIKWLN